MESAPTNDGVRPQSLAGDNINSSTNNRKERKTTMKKKIIALLLAIALVLTLAACGGGGGGQTTPAASEDGDLTFAIIPKSAGNPYNERKASGFVAAAESMGINAIVQYPEDTTAEAQIMVINNLIAQGVDGIAVAANDPYALESTLQSARDQGIIVVTLDSDARGSQMFINQAGVFEVAQALVDSVYDMTGGAGQFAVLSATSTATNQNSWIAAMHEIIDNDSRYDNLEWLTTVFGDDESQRSFDETQSLLVNFPDIDVIVAPTTVGILAAAQVIHQMDSDVLVAGLGLPSEMVGLVGEGLPTPYMYLWNPIDVGALAAYALYAILNGDTTGAEGETFTAGNGITYTVIGPDESVGVYNTQVIVGPPFRFTEDNIEEWALVY